MTKKVTYNCAYCGKECVDMRGDYSAKLRFCNKDCYNKYREERRLKGPEPNCKCENCGKPLYRSPSRLKKGAHIFCSTSCQSSKQMKEKNRKFREDLNCTCAYCGTKFHRKKSHVGVLNFCNIECKRAYQKSQRTVKKCLVCGKEFEVTKSDVAKSKFCSVKCHDEYQRRFFIKTKCAYCGKNIEVDKSTQRHNKTGHYFCSNICVGKFFSGENNPRYTGTADVVKILRTYFALHQRALVFQRDNKICQICGGKADHVHHIYPIYKIVQDFQRKHPEIDITKNCYYVAALIIKESDIFRDLNNLISICEDCHNGVHHDERVNRWVKVD